MIALHEQIASEQYWQQPPVSGLENPGFAVNALDYTFGPSVLYSIDRAYRDALAYGATHRPITYGQPLEMIIGETGILKVVEDTRTFPKKKGLQFWLEEPDLFDEVAQRMVDEMLYIGTTVTTTTEVDDVSFEVSRRALYYQVSNSGTQFTGKESGVLDRGGSVQNVRLRLFGEPVGHVRSRQTRSGRTVQSRILSAEVIKPARTSKQDVQRQRSRSSPRLWVPGSVLPSLH